MPKVTFVNDKKEIEVPVGANLRQEAMKAGIEVYNGIDKYLNCRGFGLCGTCRVFVKSGMENAKAKGAKIGRPQTTKDDIPPIFYRHYPQYTAGKLNIAELARVCDMSRTTIYKYLEMVKE